MGRGNFTPSDAYVADYEGYYVEMLDYDEGDDLISVIQERIRSRFSSFRLVKSKWDHGGKIILENELAQIIIADNEWSYAIYIVIPDTEEFPYKNLGLNKLEIYKAYLKKILLACCPESLYVRTGPWTSGKVVV